MFAAIAAETLKLRRSLVLLLCVAAPSMVALLAAVMQMTREQPMEWPMFARNCAAFWAFFMLPMTVTALTILLAQIEHGPRFWNHLLALPVARWRIYGAKAVVVIILVAAMTAAFVALIPLAGHAAEALASGVQLTGTYDPVDAARLLASMFAGSLLLIGIQLWAALRFRSFVPPLVLGIGGTFVAVIAAGARKSAYVPWLIPTNALSSDPVLAARTLGLGFWGGLALVGLMLFAMSRREAL